MSDLSAEPLKGLYRRGCPIMQNKLLALNHFYDWTTGSRFVSAAGWETCDCGCLTTDFAPG